MKISGATVHFVIPETDAGPIVMQGAVAVRDDDTADSLAARILALEHHIYPEALRLVATGAARAGRRVLPHGGGEALGRRADRAGALIAAVLQLGQEKSPGNRPGVLRERRAFATLSGNLEVFR